MEPVPKHLGELIARDRIKLGLGQEDLAKKLNEIPEKPVNDYKKKPHVFYRSWIAKLEKGLLKRNLSDKMREFLQKALNGKENLYSTLPIGSKGSKIHAFEDPETDILPLIKEIAGKGKMKTLTFEQFLALHEAHSSLSKFVLSLFQ